VLDHGPQIVLPSRGKKNSTEEATQWGGNLKVGNPKKKGKKHGRGPVGRTKQDGHLAVEAQGTAQRTWSNYGEKGKLLGKKLAWERTCFGMTPLKGRLKKKDNH